MRQRSFAGMGDFLMPFFVSPARGLVFTHTGHRGAGQKQEHKEKRFLTPARGLARGSERAEFRGRRKGFLRANPRAGVLPAQLHSLPLVRAIPCLFLLFIFSVTPRLK